MLNEDVHQFRGGQESGFGDDSFIARNSGLINME
jgi:hypothetical protein